MFDQIRTPSDEPVSRRSALGFDGLWCLLGLVGIVAAIWKPSLQRPAFLVPWAVLAALGLFWFVSDFRSPLVARRALTWRNMAVVLIAVFGRYLIEGLYEFRVIH